MLWPMWLALQGAFRTHDDTGWTTWHVAEVFRDPVTREGLLHALAFAACVTAGTLMKTKPERVIKMAVQGMLPKTQLGKQMLTKLKVYAGDQHPHSAQQPAEMAVE